MSTTIPDSLKDSLDMFMLAIDHNHNSSDSNNFISYVDMIDTLSSFKSHIQAWKIEVRWDTDKLFKRKNEDRSWSLIKGEFTDFIHSVHASKVELGSKKIVSGVPQMIRQFNKLVISDLFDLLKSQGTPGDCDISIIDDMIEYIQTAVIDNDEKKASKARNSIETILFERSSFFKPKTVTKKERLQMIREASMNVMADKLET